MGGVEIAAVFVFGRDSLVDSAASGVCHVRYQSRFGDEGWGWVWGWMHSFEFDVCREVVFVVYAGDELSLRTSRFSDDSAASIGEVEGDCPGLLSGRGKG